MQFFQKQWVRYVLVGLAALLLSGYCAATGIMVLFAVSILAATFSFVIAIVLGIKQWREAYRDPYSLEILREYVLEGRVDPDEIPVPEDGGERLCMSCNQFYGPQFPVCPRCGR